MEAIQRENAEIQRQVQFLAQRLFCEFETGKDLTTVRRILFFGVPSARVGREGGGFLELFDAVHQQMEELDLAIELKLARAGFGPAERMAALPQARAWLLGSPLQPALGGTQRPSLGEGVTSSESGARA